MFSCGQKRVSGLVSHSRVKCTLRLVLCICVRAREFLSYSGAQGYSLHECIDECFFLDFEMAKKT